MYEPYDDGVLDVVEKPVCRNVEPALEAVEPAAEPTTEPP